ncbi:MAG: YIP1 family protein [Candidatus Heimdallarchaeota archaeon]|nr:MAG: YIP1 family protein [Candidatus Heimdallarchaeota archaeon]
MSYDPPTPSPQFCGNCGQKLLKGATFCAYCGTPVPATDTSGVVTPKAPSDYSSIPPTVSPRTHPAYPPTYRPEYQMTEPPLPFIQHFQGALLSPQLEMTQIIKRPNLTHPFLVVLITGIIAGIALYILTLKTTIEFSPEFWESMGLSELDYDMGESMQIFMMMTAFFTPIGFFISWIIGSIILWVLLAIISSNVPKHERNFKTMATAVGWSFLPRIFNEIVRLVVFAVFVEPSTMVIDDLFDFSILGAPAGIIGDMLFFADILFLIWGTVLIYFAVKSLDPEGAHAVIIAIIYTVIIFFVG